MSEEQEFKSNVQEKPTDEEVLALREYLSVYKKKFTTHTCSICDYPCGYVILDGKPYYDAGVNCPKQTKYCKLEERTEEELLRYLKQNFRRIYSSAKKLFC